MVLVEFCKHNLEPEDLQKLHDVIGGPILTTGNTTKQFESEFSQYIGLPYTVALSSCTAALHLSLIALGVGKGDEVITTPMTFAATALAILHVGAKPVFVDVEPDSGLIDPFKVPGAITAKTKAILPVHLYGCMADMHALRSIADQYDLALIEDAAHCIEGQREGIRPGQLGDAVCYSFYATKNLACGEGGALATRHPEIAKSIRTLSLHGMTKTAIDRYKSSSKEWDILEKGWKYNLDNIRAALLIPQLGRLDQYWQRRREIALLYKEKLKFRTPRVIDKSAHHLHTILVDPSKRNEIISELESQGIGTAINYQAIHELTLFRNLLGHQSTDFPNAHAIGSSTLTLPLYPKLTDDALNHVINAVNRI